MDLKLLGILLFVGAFVLSVILTSIVRRLAIRKGFVSTPSEDRYGRSAIAIGGGIAIFWTIAAFLLAGVLAVKLGAMGWFGEDVVIHVEGFLSKLDKLIVVIACAFALHLMGLWDDRKGLDPFVKLGIQMLVAAAAAVFANIRVEFFIDSTFATISLSVLWMVLIINAFNFLDNMDGLSAGIAVIASSVLLTAAIIAEQVFVSGMAIVFIGSLVGFLVWNFPPAKIFMGDSGSMVVGFFVGLLTLRTTYYEQATSGGWYAVFLPLVVMAVPLYDFTSVTILRMIQGKSPMVGDTQHFSHRMKRRGLSDRQTAMTLYLATLCTGIGAVFLYQVDLTGAFLIFLQTVMILAIIAIMEMTNRK